MRYSRGLVLVIRRADTLIIIAVAETDAGEDRGDDGERSIFREGGRVEMHILRAKTVSSSSKANEVAAVVAPREMCIFILIKVQLREPK